MPSGEESRGTQSPGARSRRVSSSSSSTSRFSFRCGLIIFGRGICRKEWPWCPIRPRRRLSFMLMIYKRNVHISWLFFFFLLSSLFFPFITVVVWCCSFSCFFDLGFIYLFCCCCPSRYCSTVPLMTIFFGYSGARGSHHALCMSSIIFRCYYPVAFHTDRPICHLRHGTAFYGTV